MQTKYNQCCYQLSVIGGHVREWFILDQYMTHRVRRDKTRHGVTLRQRQDQKGVIWFWKYSTYCSTMYYSSYLIWHDVFFFKLNVSYWIWVICSISYFLYNVHFSVFVDKRNTYESNFLPFYLLIWSQIWTHQSLFHARKSIKRVTTWL